MKLRLLSECDMQIFIIKEKCINEYIKWKETNERNELSIYIHIVYMVSSQFASLAHRLVVDLWVDQVLFDQLNSSS